LGKGAFGIVYLADFKKSVVAVKIAIIPKEFSAREKRKLERLFRNEALIQGSFKHKNLVSILAISINPLAVAMDLCEGGELREFLDDPKLSYEWALLLKIAHDIAEGLEYLHSTPAGLIDHHMISHDVARCSSGSTSGSH